MIRKAISLLVLIASTGSLWAGGYRVSLQGVRQAAMGAQGVALAHDASAAFFNPAALAFVDSKLSIAVGGFGVGIKSKYQNRETLYKAETDNPLGTPLYLAASYKPTENLALGVSVTTPFGSTVDWGNDWAGRYVIDRIALKSFFIQPTAAYKVTDWLSVGAGAIIASGNVNIKRALPLGNQDAQLEIDKKGAHGTGFNLGIFAKPNEKLNIGIAYRSEVKMKADKGSATFRNLPTIVAGRMPFSAKYFDAQLPLPAELLVGANYQITPKLLIGAEIGAVKWDSYKTLNIKLYNDETEFNNSSDKNYTNTLNYSIGAEYLINPKTALRLGYKFDKSPSPASSFNPETPTINYHAFTTGLGYEFERFRVDAMAEYLVGNERSFHNLQYNFGGDINTGGYVFGLGLSYNLDR
ncbi:aromatic hydrocarbon degradation protein [Ornithobacterium rhinotracheale]|uniref:Aromatic hydrocarbon degradation protein n=1 Tax=Ornithobacterium rhinotracheale TaxID=28251 RepID=A0A3R5UUH8_ORNRH|nr:outer membrane protein transport protein [Ornithobacterium rhinotracheale]QAR30052.1 aromatic hydrocarbon degradation protein [Ornithobacterium rhinotracheale]